jgi:hypothetical protein
LQSGTRSGAGRLRPSSVPWSPRYGAEENTIMKMLGEHWMYVLGTINSAIILALLYLW